MTTRTKAFDGLSSASRRDGFTLVELMVAVLVLSVGLLGLLSTSAVVARMVGKAGRQAVAASVAETRFEKLRSSDCSALAAGSASARAGIQESWRVQRVARAVIITDSVHYVDRGVSKSHVFQSVIPCPSLP
jgi:prepilin-type N-terminal cleavage/methylation domain-containing protein